ncbi:hypothetical protein EXIGLDRAFT_784055, partial [Exidia glandulosa HHB12029]
MAIRPLPASFKLLGEADVLYPSWELRLLDHLRMQDVASYVMGVNETWPPQPPKRTVTASVQSTTSSSPSVTVQAATSTSTTIYGAAASEDEWYHVREK